MINNIEVGNRIKICRNENKWSQEELAEKLNCSRQTISNWEKGKLDLTVDSLIKLCNVFKCDSGYLLCEYKTKTHIAADIQESIELSEEAIKALRHWTALACLHDKRKQLTDEITAHEYSLKITRNDNPCKEDIIKTLSEIDKLKNELDLLEQKMLEAADFGEGYFKLLQWQAPIVCQRAWQNLKALELLINNENGEKALKEMGEYFFMEDLADGIITAANETISQRISNQDIAKIKIFNVQDNLNRVREELLKVSTEMEREPNK